MERILLIGVETEMGKSILEVLCSAHYEAHVIASKSLQLELEDLAKTNVIFHDLDLFEIDSTIELFQDMSAIIHAGMPGVFETAHHESLFKESNGLTKHIVNIALYAKVKKLIFLSSASILKSLPNKNVIDKKSDFNPKQLNSCLYNIFNEEQEVWRAWAEGMKVVILHSGIVIGNLEKGNVLYNISQWRNADEMMELGSNGFIQNFELANSVIEALDERHDNRRYICVTENKTFTSFFAKITEQYGTQNLKAPIKSLPSKLLTPVKKLLGQSIENKFFDHLDLLKAEFVFSNQEFIDSFSLNRVDS